MPNIRKPTDLHLIRGTYDKSRHGAIDSQPMPQNEVGNAPRHLTKQQKAIWKEVVRICPTGVLKESDRILVEVVSCLLAEYRESPTAFQAAKMTVLNKALGHMAMTPADRHKVVVANERDKEQDPWACL